MTVTTKKAARRQMVLDLLAKGPALQKDITAIVGNHPSVTSQLLQSMKAEGVIVSTHYGNQQQQWHLTKNKPHEPAPNSRRKIRANTYQVEVPRHPGSPERHIMRISLPAAPWGACA